MESMMLGSPDSKGNSPSSFLSSPVAGTSFLPSFLLGHDVSTDGVMSSNKSFTKTDSNVHNVSAFPTHTHDYALQSKMELKCNAATDGPPITSLMDYELVESLSSIKTPIIQTNSSFSTSNTSTLENDLLPYTGENDNYDNWVTVFGFPASKLSMVLQYFAQCGTILEKKNSLPSGNWIHLKYSMKSEANNALSRHGKKLTSSIMIGVVPYTDMRSGNITNRLNGSSIYSPASCTFSPIIPSNSLRALRTNPIHDEQMQQTANTSVRSRGLASMALDYLFGM